MKIRSLYYGTKSEFERKRDTDSNRRDLNYLKITQTIPEQHNWKAQNRGITETNHIGHCTQTAGSADIKVENIFHGRNNIMCNTNCKYITVATLNTL